MATPKRKPARRKRKPARRNSKGVKKDINWPVIKREYIAGQISLEELGIDHGITKQYISKMAKKYEWGERKGLKQAIQDRTQEMLVDERLTSEAVDVAAARGAQIVREHRRAMGDLRRIVEALNEEMGEAMASTLPKKPTKQQLKDYVFKRMGVQGKLKTCTDAIAKIIPLERQAFNIDAASTGEDLETLLRRLNDE